MLKLISGHCSKFLIRATIKTPTYKTVTVAKEDFCYTHYDGDEARDMAHMNRLERGAYTDIRVFQRKIGHLSLDQIKKVLSKDFDECWPAIELVLKQDSEGKYYIEWLENSMTRAKKHSTKQSENGKNGGRPPKNKPNENPNETQTKPNHNPTESQKKPLGDGDEYGYEEESKEGGVGETIPVGIVPDMLHEFMVANPDYPSDQLTDFPALRLIASKILKWEKLGGDITQPENAEVIKRRWGELVPFIRADQHFGGYSILQINKYFQSIAQRFNNVPAISNQRPAAGSHSSKPGTSEARVQRAKEW